MALCWLILWIDPGQAQNSGAAPNATVKSDALVVYSDMRTSSAAVSSLKKGDQVVVDFEFKTSAAEMVPRQTGVAEDEARLRAVRRTRPKGRGRLCSLARNRHFESGGEQFAAGASSAAIDERIR